MPRAIAREICQLFSDGFAYLALSHLAYQVVAVIECGG